MRVLCTCYLKVMCVCDVLPSYISFFLVNVNVCLHLVCQNYKIKLDNEKNYDSVLACDNFIVAMLKRYRKCVSFEKKHPKSSLHENVTDFRNKYVESCFQPQI